MSKRLKLCSGAEAVQKFKKQDGLRCFFDITEINAMDDWRNRILCGLRESNMLLLILTPSYLKSPYCEWEIVEFLKYENSRAVQGQGVAQVYFARIPGLDTPGFEQQAATLVARVRQRNHVDLLGMMKGLAPCCVRTCKTGLTTSTAPCASGSPACAASPTPPAPPCP